MSISKHNQEKLIELASKCLADNRIDDAIGNMMQAALVCHGDEKLIALFHSLKKELAEKKFEQIALEQIRRLISAGDKSLKEEKVSSVTLVQAPRWNINQPALALGVLTACLRTRGFSVKPFDFDVDLYNSVTYEDKKYWDDSNEDFWLNSSGIISLLDKYPAFIYFCLLKILERNPQVIGFSVQTKSKQISLLLAEKIRKIAPEKYIVLGGPETSLGPDIMLAPYSYIDAIFIGEADLSFPEFLCSLNIQTKESAPVPGVIFRNQTGELIAGGPITALPLSDVIPLADFSDIDFTKYRVPNSVNLILSRGCVNRCSFCNESPVFKKFRAYKAERAYQEILSITKNTNIADNPRICYNDSLLNGDLDELERFCDLLIEKPIRGLTFSGMMLVRPQMSERLIEKLAKAKCCEVFFGVENGCDEVLAIMRKNYNTDDVERIVRQMHKYGIRITAFIMVGHPGETEFYFYKSLNFVRKIAQYLTMISFNLTQILENSDIKKRPEKYNVTNTDQIHWVADSGNNTYEVRKQRQFLARTLLGDKAYGMGYFEDPIDPESKYYYSQGRNLYAEHSKCITRRAEGMSHVGKIEALLARNGIPVPSRPEALCPESIGDFSKQILENWKSINCKYGIPVVYGAGKYATNLIAALHANSLPLPKLIWDDAPGILEIYGVPVEKTPAEFSENINAVVLGSDTYQVHMSLRLKEISGVTPVIIDLVKCKAI